MTNNPVKFDMPSTGKVYTKMERTKEININKLIKEDISCIEEAIKSSDPTKMKDVHIRVDAHFQSCIEDWGKGLYGYDPKFGQNYDYLDDFDSLVNNLTNMKYKLEAYKCSLNAKTGETVAQNNISVAVNNNISIETTINEACKKIQDMPGLTKAETEEIIARIKDLEKISKKNIGRKEKWESMHPILSLMLDKSIDVAVVVFSLFLQMNI